MKEEGHLDGRLSEWASILRGVRNAGAHFDVTKPPIERQDAADALAFSEALLDYLFVLKARFEQLRDRRTPRKLDTAGAQALAALVLVGADAIQSTRAKRLAKRKPAEAAAPVTEAAPAEAETASALPTHE